MNNRKGTAGLWQAKTLLPPPPSHDVLRRRRQQRHAAAAVITAAAAATATAAERARHDAEHDAVGEAEGELAEAGAGECREAVRVGADAGAVVEEVLRGHRHKGAPDELRELASERRGGGRVWDRLFWGF